MIFTLNKAGFVVVGSLALIGGFAVGMAIGSPRAPDSKAASTLGKAHRQNPLKSNLEGSAHSPGPTKRTEGHTTPTSVIPDLSSDPNLIAQELWEIVTEQKPTVLTPADRRKRLREFGPQMAAFFIRKFWEATSNDLGRQMALEMAITCGGPQAVSFLEELASRKSDHIIEHYLRIAISVLGDGGDRARRPLDFPVSESLMARTQVQMASSDKEDRRMAMAVLGYAQPAVALPLLTGVLRTDPDPYVRMAAIRELARMGDTSTLDLLRANRDSYVAEVLKLAGAAKPGDEVTLLAPTLLTRTIDDAIEQLEERLQRKQK